MFMPESNHAWHFLMKLFLQVIVPHHVYAWKQSCLTFSYETFSQVIVRIIFMPESNHAWKQSCLKEIMPERNHPWKQSCLKTIMSDQFNETFFFASHCPHNVRDPSRHRVEVELHRRRRTNRNWKEIGSHGSLCNGKLKKWPMSSHIMLCHVMLWKLAQW
jgi:hypothetical protein